MTRLIGPDEFSSALDEIFSDVQLAANNGVKEAVGVGIRKGASAWRKNAKEAFGRGKNSHTYKRGGQRYSTGEYAASIRGHVIDRSEEHPAGEIGSPTLPGLPHLLEFGHAKVGGGRVNGIEHVKPAADEAFEDAFAAAEKKIEEGLRG